MFLFSSAIMIQLESWGYHHICIFW